MTGDATFTERGVDATNSFTLRYRDGRMALLSSCMTAWMPNTGILCGKKGYIVAHDFWTCQRITVCVRGEKPYEIHCPFEISGYEYEVRAAIKAIHEGRLFCDEMPWDESVRLMKVMDALAAKWKK